MKQYGFKKSLLVMTWIAFLLSLGCAEAPLRSTVTTKKGDVDGAVGEGDSTAQNPKPSNPIPSSEPKTQPGTPQPAPPIAQNPTPTTPMPTTPTPRPAADNAPDTWKEHWFDHTQLLKRAYLDDNVAIYFDDDVDKEKALAWLVPLLTKTWAYTKANYGNFGGGRLYAIFHAHKYSGGHPSTYNDGSHDFRNVIDVGTDGDWNDPNSDWGNAATVHEVGHIVEGAAFDFYGSPAFPLWHDSKWCEIYVYDIYRNIGMKTFETNWYNQQMASNGESFPTPGSKWFKNWYYPILNDMGGTKTLAKFFTLLNKNFPKNAQKTYTRNMNFGEYVHFYSGAVGRSLKDQATAAFGWSNELDAQYQKARKDFPGVTY